MKELKAAERVYLEQYDVHVNRYLTLAQIQQIVNAIKVFDTWAEREQNKNMLVLYHATDIGKEALEASDYDLLQSSGLIDSVLECVVNIHDIDKALDWTESTQRALAQIIKDGLPQIRKILENPKAVAKVKK